MCAAVKAATRQRPVRPHCRPCAVYQVCCGGHSACFSSRLQSSQRVCFHDKFHIPCSSDVELFQSQIWENFEVFLRLPDAIKLVSSLLKVRDIDNRLLRCANTATYRITVPNLFAISRHSGPAVDYAVRPINRGLILWIISAWVQSRQTAPQSAYSHVYCTDSRVFGVITA